MGCFCFVFFTGNRTEQSLEKKIGKTYLPKDSTICLFAQSRIAVRWNECRALRLRLWSLFRHFFRVKRHLAFSRLALKLDSLVVELEGGLLAHKSANIQQSLTTEPNPGSSFALSFFVCLFVCYNHRKRLPRNEPQKKKCYRRSISTLVFLS